MENLYIYIYIVVTWKMFETLKQFLCVQYAKKIILFSLTYIVIDLHTLRNY